MNEKLVVIASAVAIAVVGLSSSVAQVATLPQQGEGALAQSPLNLGTGATPAFIMAVDDSGSMCAAMIKAHRAGVGNDLRPWIDNYVQYVSGTQFRLADGTLARNRPLPESLWQDDLYMSVPCLAQMGQEIEQRHGQRADAQRDELSGPVETGPVNARADRGEAEVTKISIAAYARIRERYALLRAGGAAGDRDARRVPGYGTLLGLKSGGQNSDRRGHGY